MANASRIRPWKQDEFTPTNGQVTFILSSAPLDPLSVQLTVNGVDYDDGNDFVLSGVTLTWLNAIFSMSTTDFVLVKYV